MESRGTVSTPGLLWPSLAVLGVTLFATFVLVNPWPLDVPVSWGGDTLEHAVLADSANWLGQPGFSEETGAPHGVDWSLVPSGGERLHLAGISLLSDVTGSIWVAMNLHLLLGVAATALAAFLVLRWMGVTDLFAGAGAIVFALGSAVYDHIEQGHLFLFAMYPVPLAVYLAVRWSGWRPPGASGRDRERAEGSEAVGSHRGELWTSAACVVLIGLSSTYYALFAVLTIALLAVLVAARNLEWRRAVPGLIASASTAVVVGLSSLPAILGGDATRLERRLSDSIRFALDPLMVLVPQGENPLGVLGWGSAPSQAIGVAATVGLVWLGSVLLGRLGSRDRPVDGLLLRIAAVVGISLAVGVAGGIGWLIARLGAQELRAWSRVSVFIGFAGLAALGVLASRSMARREAPRYLVLATVLVVLLALGEQRSMIPDASQVAEQQSLAAGFVEDLEGSLPEGSEVLVLPAGSYLNDFGPGQALALPLLGESLRYSAGSLRGGSGDWQLTWALEPIESQLQVAAAGGFDAVALQADHHRLEDPDALVVAIGEVLGDPAGEVGEWKWWDLSALRAELESRHGVRATSDLGEAALRPLGMVIEGTPGFPSSGSERDAVVGESSAVRVVSVDGSDEAVVVAFEVVAAPGSRVELGSDGGSGFETDVISPGPRGARVVRELAVDDGEAELRIEVTGPPLRRGDDDPDVYAELREVQAFDASVGDRATAVPRALR